MWPLRFFKEKIIILRENEKRTFYGDGEIRPHVVLGGAGDAQGDGGGVDVQVGECIGPYQRPLLLLFRRDNRESGVIGKYYLIQERQFYSICLREFLLLLL